VTRAAVALAWTALVAGAAHAEPPRVDHYEAGKQLFTARRYAEALDEFRRALALAPRPEVLYAIAQAQRMVGDCPGAIETYRAFLAGQPGEPLDEYARANIQRCEADRRTARGDVDPGPAWYRDGVGDALVGGGLIAGVAGAVIWRSGRSTAGAVASAPDYPTFVQRRSAAASALTEQQIGVAAMLVGGTALVAGVVHYVRHAHPAPREPALGVALTAGGAMLAGRGTF
jgi:tetratricopeptide (TPR) repeat protein